MECLCGVSFSQENHFIMHNKRCKKVRESSQFLDELFYNDNEAPFDCLCGESIIEKEKIISHAKHCETVIKCVNYFDILFEKQDIDNNYDKDSENDSENEDEKKINPELFQTAFDDKLKIYRFINNDKKLLSLDSFLNRLLIKEVIKNYLLLFKRAKFQISVTIEYCIMKDDEVTKQNFVLNHKFEDICLGDILDETIWKKKINNVFSKILTREDLDKQEGSGWTIDKIVFADLKLCYRVFGYGGAPGVNVPKFLSMKGALINSTKSDNMCFYWAVIGFLLFKELKPSFELKLDSIKDNKNLTDKQKKSQKEREYRVLNKRLDIISHSDQSDIVRKYQLDFSGLSFPVAIEELQVFMQNNRTLNLNVFTVDIEEKHVVGPLFVGGERRTTTIHLLFLNNGDIGHYMAIRSLSRLASKQLNQQRYFYIFFLFLIISLNEKNPFFIQKHNTILRRVLNVFYKRRKAYQAL